MHDQQERYAWFITLIRPPLLALMTALAGGVLWHWGLSVARDAREVRQRQEQLLERQARQIRRLRAAADHLEGEVTTAGPNAMRQLCQQNAERYGVSMVAWQPVPLGDSAMVTLQGKSVNLLLWWDATARSDVVTRVHEWQWERLSERLHVAPAWPTASNEARLTMTLQPASQYWKERA